MIRTATLILLVAFCTSSCRAPLRSDDSFSCAEAPVYTQIPKNEVSVSRLIQSYLLESRREQVLAARMAAEGVETRLSREGSGDIEDWFYQNQILQLRDYCKPQNGQDASSVAIAFIDYEAAALATASGLREADLEVVDRMLPATSVNLTARMNSVVLAASCTSSRHPFLARALHGIGLPCGNE